MTDDYLPPDQVTIAVRAAHEGIPIASIGRILAAPFSLVHEYLTQALGSGRISTIPKPDWPPVGKWDDRTPSIPRTVDPKDAEFELGKVFRLTRLEGGILMVLLRCDNADKFRLHAVVEEQRNNRQLRPDNSDATDPKIVDVMICKLRKKLRKVDPAVVIETNWGRGYFISPAVKTKIYEILSAAQT